MIIQFHHVIVGIIPLAGHRNDAVTEKSIEVLQVEANPNGVKKGLLNIGHAIKIGWPAPALSAC
jgi:hypothetical protein